MSRTNRPDTLLTELRDLKRRLRLLEAARMRPPAAALTAARTQEPDLDAPPQPAASGPEPAARAEPGPAGGASAVRTPLLPARSQDWPNTRSDSWEQLAVTWLAPGGRTVLLTLDAAATRGTEGEARVTVDGQPVDGPWPVTSAVGRRTLTIQPATSDDLEIAVEARRTAGRGSVRIAATVRLTG